MIVTNFFELFVSAGGRAPAAIADRLVQAASVLFGRQRHRRRKRVGPAPPALLTNNHLRRDIGLPPLDSRGRPF
jgi:hypothetical protein